MPDNSSLLLDIADVLLFISSLAVWAIVFWRWRTGRTIVPYELRRPVPWLGVDLALVILAFLVAGASCNICAQPHDRTSSGPAADSSTVVKPANPPKGQTEHDDANSKTMTRCRPGSQHDRRTGNGRNGNRLGGLSSSGYSE